MATFWEIAARSVNNKFVLIVFCLFVIFIYFPFGFKSRICLLIAPVPVHCFSITLIAPKAPNCIQNFCMRYLHIAQSKYRRFLENTHLRYHRYHTFYCSKGSELHSRFLHAIFAYPFLEMYCFYHLYQNFAKILGHHQEYDRLFQKRDL